MSSELGNVGQMTDGHGFVVAVQNGNGQVHELIGGNHPRRSAFHGDDDLLLLGLLGLPLRGDACDSAGAAADVGTMHVATMVAEGPALDSLPTIGATDVGRTGDDGGVIHALQF